MAAEWVGLSAQPRIQHAAVAAVTSVGGNVMYDWEWNKRKAYTASTGWIPKWALDNLGTDYFHTVTSVWLYYVSTEADTVLIPVSRLTRLEWLSLIGASVTDNGLARWRGMTSLTRLELDYTPITDAGLANMKGLTGLTVLSLNGTHITDAGLAHLKTLTSLTELNLAGTPITDAGLCI